MIKGLEEKIPNIHKSCFVAENAAVVGDVVIGENTFYMVWGLYKK